MIKSDFNYINNIVFKPKSKVNVAPLNATGFTYFVKPLPENKYKIMSPSGLIYFYNGYILGKDREIIDIYYDNNSN